MTQQEKIKSANCARYKSYANHAQLRVLHITWAVHTILHQFK